MATQWISPTWRMPKNSNQNKVDNYSLDFDGTAEYITVGQISEINSASAVTISYWAKKEAASGDDMAVGSLVASTNGIWLQWYTDNNVYFSPRNGGTTNVSTSLTGDTNWHHLVGVYDGTNMTIYIDGAQAVTSTTSVPAALSATAGDNFQIGALNGGYFTSGQINQVTVYEQALTSDQVTALYKSGTPVNPMALTPLPIAYYPLGDTATGSSTTLTVPNDAVPDATVFNFVESSTQYIDIGTNNSVLMPTDEFSISLWVKFSAAAMGNIRGLFSANSNSGYDGYVIWKDAGNNIDLYINDGGWKVASGPTIVQDTWYHVVGTWDGSTGRIYVDNVDEGNVAVSSIVYNASTVNRIGDYANYEMDGDMANVQFWNKGLSAPNVTTLYNNGVPLYTGTQPEASNLKGWWKLNVDNSTWGGSNWSITDSSGEGNTGTSSGMNTANLVTSDLTRSIPYSSYSMTFDGVDDYIDVTQQDLGTVNTVSWWMKRANTSAVGETIFGEDNGTQFYSFIYIDWNANILYYKDPSNNKNTWSTTSFNNTDWHNCIITRDGTTTILYVDGVSLGVGTVPVNPLSGNSKFRYLGADYSDMTREFEGNLSNVAVWTSVLTADQALTLYNGGVPNSISSLSPISWWSLAGDSYYNGSNFICPDLGSASNNGTSSGMGGTELVGDGPGSTANGVATSMDIPVNLKGDAPNSTDNSTSINMTAIDRVSGAGNIPG